MGQFEPDEGTEEVEITLSGGAEFAELPDVEAPAEDAEARDETPAEESDSFARMEEIDKGLDKLRKHVAKRVGEILGDDAPFYTECELCTPFGVPGLRPPVDLPPDVQAHLYHLLGQRSPTDLLPDPHSEVCPECNGEGTVATRSRVPGQDQLSCVNCGALGWLPVGDARRPKGMTAANGVTATYPAPAQEASALPNTQADEDPRAKELRQLGYAVIPPMVMSG